MPVGFPSGSCVHRHKGREMLRWHPIHHLLLFCVRNNSHEKKEQEAGAKLTDVICHHIEKVNLRLDVDDVESA